MNIQSLVETVKGSTIELLSEIEVSQEEYDALINYAQTRICHLDASIPPNEDIKLALCLVQVAIRKYTEGNYWHYFKQEIDIELPQHKQTYIGKSFLKTIEKYKLFSIGNSESGNAQYVENIKAHAFVPNNYLKGYYDFLFSFYEGNLLRVVPEDLFDDIIPMQLFMKSSLSSSNDSIVLDNSSFHNAKTYRLLKATRNVFANLSTAKLSNIFLQHIKMLDNFYYDGTVPIVSDRFSKGFSDWIIDFENEYTENSSKRVLRKRGPVNHKPYFKLINESVYLIIPPQKFREEEYNGNIELLINDIRIKSLDVYNQWGIKVSEEEAIKIDNIFDNYNIRILSNSEKKYPIPDQNYRLFNEDWEEISKPKRDTNYIIYRKGTSVSAKDVNTLSYPFPSLEEFNICQADFFEDTVVFIDDSVIRLERVFTGKTDMEQFVSNRYYIENVNGQKVHTVYRHIVISFVIKKELFEKTILHCNDEQFKLNIPGTTEQFEIPYDDSVVGVEINLNNILVSTDGLYKIWLDEPTKKNRLIIEYLLLTNLWCSPDKPRYFLMDEAIITSNNNYSLIPINCTKIAESKYILDLHTNKTAEFSIIVDSNDYYVYVPVKVVEFYTHDKWFWTKQPYLWIDDFTNTMLVKLPGAIQCGAYLDDNPECVSELGVLKNGIFEFNMTEIRNEIISSSNDRHFLHILFQDTQAHDNIVFNILKSLWFRKFNCINVNCVFVLDADFDGNANCYIDVYSKQGDLLVKNKQIKKGYTELPELSVTGIYDFLRKVTKPDDFGFDEIEIDSWWLRNIGVISSLEDCNILISHIMHKGVELPLNRKYTIKSIMKINDDSYVGKLYEKQNGPFVEHVIFPKIMFKVIDEQRKRLLIYIEDGEDWIEPIYDKLNKRIISEDMITKNDYSRFISLFEDDTVYYYKNWREK